MSQLNFANPMSILENESGQLAGVNVEETALIEPTTANRHSFFAHAKYAGEEVVENLKKGSKRVLPYRIYMVESLAPTTVKAFESSRKMVVGLRNIEGLRLMNGQKFLPVSVQFLAGEGTFADPGKPTEDEIKAINFEPLEKVPGIAGLVNGEYSLKVGNTKLISDRNPIQIHTYTQTNDKMGAVPVEFPVWVDETMDWNLDIELAASLPTHYVKIIIEGVIQG